MQITPTVGRVVLYRPNDEDFNEAIRFAATVAFVHSDGAINIGGVDLCGVPFNEQMVTLVQGDEVPAAGQCEWMPYQKGQAAKTEAIEKELEDVGTTGGHVDASSEAPIVTLGGDAVHENEDPSEDIPEPLDFIAIAEACHEANREYCASIGDLVKAPWSACDEHQRASVLNGVHEFIENPDLTPELMHENWMAMKIAAGWEYGEDQCPIDKTHPCLVLYDDLPEEQRRKDEIFISTIIEQAGLVSGE